MAQKLLGQFMLRTNKAEFYRLPNGSLLKRYFADKKPMDKVLQDRRSLEYLQKNFGEVDYQGWRYRSVRLLGVSVEQGSVCLEFVPGDVLSGVSRSKINEAEYHCGVWMALYHRKVLGGRLKGLIYPDFNVHNVIIDFERKRVTAIDPGMSWGRTGYVYQDLLKHIHSLLVTLIFTGKAPLASVLRFLKGYAYATDLKLNLWAYYKSLWREIRRQFSAYAAKSYLKCLLYPAILALTSMFYLGFIPGYFLLKDFQRSSRSAA